MSSSVAMETGKPGLASAPVHINSIAAQTEKRMDIQAPLTAVYIHTVPALPGQPYPQLPAAAREPATLQLAIPPLYSKETLPFLTLHIAGGLQSQPGLSLAVAAPAARPKSAGKHVCPHCGRDCMKPSVLEKHLRCHTGERPYPCTTCGVSFKTQSNLYKHKRTQAHARLSSESEQSSLGSVDNMSSSRETCIFSLSLDERSEESGSMEKDVALPAAEITCPVKTAKVYSVKTESSVSEQNVLTPAGHKTEPNESAKENEKPQLIASHHLPLKRQEATLFSKQWESSGSRGKSQSHESTDSGFSESSDHYSSPGSILPDHSMDSLTKSTKELDETTNTLTPLEPGQGGQEPTTREQEQRTLEERISKLISENTAVVEDKQLENVRPRKTVLSKQGSIDLPMPYTYKDSFHFDMRMSKTLNVGLQRNKKPAFYSSVPTQCSTTTEHAPLTRSNSLPFSVTLLQPERSSPTSSYQSDYVTLIRRGSSGQINPTGFAIKPVNQQSSTHRPLVRQTAVDCNHATDSLFMNSSVEEACTGSLSCDGDGGDICGEPSNQKFQRKKTQKFAYNKWYMYGGGTFKKLYNAEKSGDESVIKGRKCSTNPEHEVVQGLQKRLSAVHKETVTTTGPTVNLTSNSATVCHPDCPPAKLSLVSAVDFNWKTSQLHTACSSLKTPLQRNLSMSILSLPSIESLVSHKTDSMSRAAGAHIPSQRKKQKTDEKIICPLEMETDQNTLTHTPPSVTGSAPQQDTNLSYINLQDNQHTELKGALFLPCIINANTLSVSTSPATSTPSSAKTSFLPKYQLKLPNAIAEPDSNPSSHVVDIPTRTDGCTFTSALSCSHTEQMSPSLTTSVSKCNGPVTSLLMQSCEIAKTNAVSSLQGQFLLPCTATTLCQAETSRLKNQNATSSLTVVHRQFAATTITTTCLKDYQAELCNTSAQSSKSAGGLPRPVAPMVSNFPGTSSITTANNPTSVAAITAFSQGQLNPYPKPLVSHTQLSSASDQLNPVNGAYTSSNTPAVPCDIVPFDQMHPAAQNVFHVHTADLQICLQIISDEQLALIEPQIERQAGSILSNKCDVEAVVQIKAQNSVTLESRNEGTDHQPPGYQKELDKSESLPTHDMERIKPPLSVQFGKAEPNLHLTEHNNSAQATVFTESNPPDALGLLQRPHEYGHLKTVTETHSSTGNLMSSAFKGIKSKRSQHAKSEASAYNNSRLESGETHPSLQVGLGQASVVGCADEPSGSVSSFSINKCKVPRQFNPQASIYCSNPMESLNSFKYANMESDSLGPLDNVVPSQEITQNELQKVISSAHSEKQVGQPVSCDIQMERPKDILAVHTSIQSPAAGLIERASLTGYAAQNEPQKQGHERTPGQPVSIDWPQPSQEVLETNHQCMEGQDGGEVAAEDENRGINTDGVPGQWCKAESNCRYTCLQDMTKPEGEERQVQTHSFKTSQQHLKHLSQTHSGMSEYPSHCPKQTLSTSNNPNLPASSSQTSLFNSPQPTNNIYFSQQHWESSIIHNQQTQILCESNSSQHIKTQAQLTDTQNCSQIESRPEQTQTFSHQDQKQASIRTVSCSSKLTLGSHKSLLSDVKTSSPTHLSQVSYFVQVSRATAGLTEDTQASNNNVLDNNTVLPSKPFTYPEPDGYQDTKDKAPNDFMSQSSNSGRPDITNKYQSFFLAGQHHGDPPAECQTGEVRPVQSYQDYTEDTSSSDDEGKLIIEL